MHISRSTLGRLLIVGLFVSLAIGGVAVAQGGPPDSPPPGDGAGSVLPPEAPPEAPPGAVGEGGVVVVEETPDPDPNAPDANVGFPAGAMPPDIRAELERILPDGEPDGDGLISMAFDKAEIEDFLKFVATETGYTILPPAELTGQITIVSRVDVTIDDALAILEAWLRIRSFTMLKNDTDQIISIVPLSKVKTTPGPVRHSDEGAYFGSPSDFITRVIQLENIQADKVLEVVTPLVDTEQGSITASADVNAVIITDMAANIDRVLEVISGLDQPLSPVQVEVIPLEYATASEIAEALNSMFGEGTNLPPEMLARMGIDPNTVQQGPGGFIGRAMQVKIVSDERTNSLVVSANEGRMEMIKSIVEKLDVDTSADVVYKVFKLELAEAQEVADLLNQIFEQPQGGPSSGGGIFGGMARMFMGGRQQQQNYSGLKENIVVADTRTNSVIVTAAQENMTAFEDLIEQLDQVQPMSELTRIYELENAQAEELSEVLTQAFQGQGGQGGGFLSFIFGGRMQSSGPLQRLQDITVTAETKSNSLIVTAPLQAFELVEQLIKDLDKPQKQVYISVIIADVTLNDDLRYGVEWNWFTRSDPTFTGSSAMGLDEWDEGIRWGVISDTIQGFLEALEKETEISVISTPSILTLDNVQGTISSGREITIRTGSRENASGSVEDLTSRIEAAIVLDVTPRINDSGFVQLDINQTIDDIGETDSYGNPSIVRREAIATVLVQAGETVVLGGVIQEDRRVTERGIPVLKELPLIGSLFKSKEETVRRSELMVFITPYVLEDEVAARALRIREQEKMQTNLEEMFPMELSTQPLPEALVEDDVAPVAPPAEPQPVATAAVNDPRDEAPYVPLSRGGRRH